MNKRLYDIQRILDKWEDLVDGDLVDGGSVNEVKKVSFKVLEKDKKEIEWIANSLLELSIGLDDVLGRVKRLSLEFQKELMRRVNFPVVSRDLVSFVEDLRFMFFQVSEAVDAGLRLANLKSKTWVG